MKRNEHKTPGLDDIIFENRNRNYGAYDLRKRYNSTTAYSILAGVGLSTALLVAVSISDRGDAIASPDKQIYIVVKTDNSILPENVVQPELPKPQVKSAPLKYLAPDVTDDLQKVTEMLTTEFAADSVENGIVTEVFDSTFFERVEIDEPLIEEPMHFVEEDPLFPGGSTALMKFIADNLRYPAEAIENNIQGRVYLKFAVGSNGSVSRVEVLKGVHPLLDQEAVRVVSTLPDWKPGRQNGRAVAVWFNVPVTFRLLER